MYGYSLRVTSYLKRMGLSFTIAAVPRQCSHSQDRVPWDTWSHFTLSDSRFSQPGWPGPRIHIPQEPGYPVMSPVASQGGIGPRVHTGYKRGLYRAVCHQMVTIIYLSIPRLYHFASKPSVSFMALSICYGFTWSFSLKREKVGGAWRPSNNQINMRLWLSVPWVSVLIPGASIQQRPLSDSCGNSSRSTVILITTPVSWSTKRQRVNLLKICRDLLLHYDRIDQDLHSMWENNWTFR
jgi:hypothetical protein